MLNLKGVHAGYGRIEVLKGIDLYVNPDEIVAIIGPNGAGKSTIIKSIFNLASITSGKIFFQEKDITNLKTHELINMGIAYVNQGRIIFGNLSVRENLEIGADAFCEKELVERTMDMVLSKFPALEEKLDVLAYTLSGGQRQMLALGRALMQNPSLLLLDEPSLGLSPNLQQELFQHIKKLKRDGISVVVVEQNAKKAIETADRTYLLEDGKVALEGGKEMLKHSQIKQVYLGGAY